MKYLTDYIQEKQTTLFKKYQVFFAFSNEQFAKGKEENNIQAGTRITHCGMGLYLPSEHADAFIEEYEKLVDDGIAQDIADNGIENIIVRELSNHEAWYTGNIESTYDAIKDYGITKDDILAVYKKEYSNNYDREQAVYF